MAHERLRSCDDASVRRCKYLGYLGDRVPGRRTAVIAMPYAFSLTMNAVALRKSAGGWPAVSEEWLKATSRPIRAARVDSSMPERRASLELPGRRPGQLRGRPAGGQAADRRRAGDGARGARLPGVPPPGGHATWRPRRAIRQFLDIGTGMPTAGNTHEVAQAVDPSCRVVYVDNDPVVLSHARARLRSSDEGATSYLDADARDTKAIVSGARETLDFGQAGRRHHDRHPELPRGRGRRAVAGWLDGGARRAATWPSCSRRGTSG